MEQREQAFDPGVMQSAAQQAGVQRETIERMSQTIEDLRKFEKKNYRINRIRMICSILSLLIMAVVAVVVFKNVKLLMGKAEQVTQTVADAGTQFERVAGDIDVVAKDLEHIDFEKLGNTLQEIADLSKDTVEQVNDAAGDLDSIVNTAGTVLDNLNSIKIDSLNDGIEELNTVLAKIKDFFARFPI